MDPHSQELFAHIRVVMGMVVGLSVTRLLSGLARMIQHPKPHHLSAIHLLWVFSLLVELALFWWWEFALSQLPHITFGKFLFLIGYAFALFLLCALLFPDELDDYADYEVFFIDRRRWFFSVFALTFVLDTVDTAIKGAEYWSRYSADYLAQVPIGLTLSAVAFFSSNRRVQLVIVLLHLAYQAYWIARVITGTD